MGKTRRVSKVRGFAEGRRHDGAPFVLSTHAVDRFRERICPQFSWGRAKGEARALSLSARKTDDLTGRGEEIWEATDGAPVRFVVRNEGGRRTCVTCLAARAPGGSGPSLDIDDEFRDG